MNRKYQESHRESISVGSSWKYPWSRTVSNRICSHSPPPEASNARKSTNKSSRMLPETFQPTTYTVVIGKSKASKEAIGNQHLRALAHSFLPRYSDARTKSEKSDTVSAIVKIVKSSCPLGAFVKRDDDTGRYYEVPDATAREKVGYIMRDLLHDKYKSSSASKSARRLQAKLGQFPRKHTQTQSLARDAALVQNCQDHLVFEKLQILTGCGTSQQALPTSSSVAEVSLGSGEVAPDYIHIPSNAFEDTEPLPLYPAPQNYNNDSTNCNGTMNALVRAIATSDPTVQLRDDLFTGSTSSTNEDNVVWNAGSIG